MPRTKLDDIAHPRPPRPPIDHVKALIMERVMALDKTPEECSAAIGVSTSTFFRRQRQPTSEWPLGEVLGLCLYLGIEIDELRAAIRYKGVKTKK